MSLSDAARHLQGILGDHGALIGGVCGVILGVERFTRDVDFATDLEPEGVVEALRDAGIESTIRRAAEPDELPWVVAGEIDDVPFQVLPARNTGIDVSQAETRGGLRVPGVHAFIEAKCIAGGHQDLHDVAVLCLIDPDVEGFARAASERHGRTDMLEACLADERLRKRYVRKGGR